MWLFFVCLHQKNLFLSSWSVLSILRERENSFRLASILCSKFHDHKMAKSVDTNLPLSDHKNPKNPLKALNIFNEAKSRYPNYFHNDPIYATMINILRTLGRLSEMRDVIEQMRDDSCECNDYVCVCYQDVCECRAGGWSNLSL